jgi:hypothetical protein
MAATNPVDKFVYQQVDDPALRQQLIDIANTFWCVNGGQNEWISFFSNPDNIEGIKEAQSKLGIPPKNREAWRSKGLFGKWHDYCDWGDIYRFWYYAKLALDFPALNPDVKMNCYTINSYLQGLEAEKVSVDTAYATTNDNERHIRQLEVIADKIAEANGIYATMTCDLFISEQEAQKLAAQRAAALAQSQKSNIAVYQATAGASGGGTGIAIYVFGGVAALIAIMLFRKKTSSN